VVVVDDNTEIQDLLAMVLEQRGYEVVCFSDGIQAIEGIPMHKPDVILLDIIMPGKDGLEVCDFLKTDPELKSIPVFLMTSATSGSDLADGFWKIGTLADAFFSKPFNPLAVAAYVDNRVLGTALPPELNRHQRGGGAARIPGGVVISTQPAKVK
jgi:CheY-like chemotaxis protein